jgi:hypothetical protein
MECWLWTAVFLMVYPSLSNYQVFSVVPYFPIKVRQGQIRQGQVRSDTIGSGRSRQVRWGQMGLGRIGSEII